MAFLLDDAVSCCAGLHTNFSCPLILRIFTGMTNKVSILTKKLKHYERATRVDRMVRDVARYLPAVLDAKYVDSLFEVKTVLVKNEVDDGRPILFENHQELPGCYSVLGGKIEQYL